MSKPSEFHAMEHAGWEGAVQEYDDAFARLTGRQRHSHLAARVERDAFDGDFGPEGFAHAHAAVIARPARGRDCSNIRFVSERVTGDVL